jgi:hypothetical protein
MAVVPSPTTSLARTRDLNVSMSVKLKIQPIAIILKDNKIFSGFSQKQTNKQKHTQTNKQIRNCFVVF